MQPMKKLYAVLIAATALAIGSVSMAGVEPASVQQPVKLTALVGGALIDVVNSKILPNTVILIRGERIERIGTVGSLAVPAGYEQISTEGMTLMPGLWELHIHLQNSGHNNQFWHTNMTDRYEREVFPANLEMLLMAGVTTARDMGTTLNIFNVIKRVNAGEIPGPTYYASGPQMVNMPAAWAARYNWQIKDVADARAKAKQIMDAGGNSLINLKVTSTEDMAVDVLKAIAEEAHSRGKRVATHGRSMAEIKKGLEVGFDEFQHIAFGEPEYPEDVMAAIRQRVKTGPPLYWMPTVQIEARAYYTAQNREILDDPANYKGLAPDMVTAIKDFQKTFKPEPNPQMFAIMKRKYTQLKEAGVRLLIGSDGGATGSPHSGAMWQEMDNYVTILGEKPMDVIRMATIVNAQYFGADKENGSVNEGKYADIIAVRGDPLRGMVSLANPTIIIKHGRRYK
jgi:imidazolonepropionase-like amidohydrolase